MVDIIVSVILVLILGGAIAYIVKSKKSGKKCIGCPDGGSCCSKKNDGSPCCCGCSEEK